jgi:hypothetical protein
MIHTTPVLSAKIKLLEQRVTQLETEIRALVKAIEFGRNVTMPTRKIQ